MARALVWLLLFVRRQPWLALGGLLAVLAWRSCGGGDPGPAQDAHLQAAVLGDGFAFQMWPSRVVEVDRAGDRQATIEVRLGGKPFRVVGTRAGTGIGWQDGKKVKLGTLASGGEVEDVSTWGKSARQLCEGAATNEHRFGVGWLENDGRVWFVHGPMKRGTTETMAASFEPGAETQIEPLRVTWCAIASAEDNIALIWRDGQRTFMNLCTRKQCNVLIRVPLDARDVLLGVGCVRDSCLFATRDPNGNVKLRRVTETGSTIVKKLEHVYTGSDVSVVGAGDRGFAIAYVGVDNVLAVQRITIDGALSNVWRGEAGSMASSLAWADGKLLVVQGGGETTVLEFPR